MKKITARLAWFMMKKALKEIFYFIYSHLKARKSNKFSLVHVIVFISHFLNLFCS